MEIFVFRNGDFDPASVRACAHEIRVKTRKMYIILALKLLVRRAFWLKSRF